MAAPHTWELTERQKLSEEKPGAPFGNVAAGPVDDRAARLVSRFPPSLKISPPRLFLCGTAAAETGGVTDSCSEPEKDDAPPRLSPRIQSHSLEPERHAQRRHRQKSRRPGEQIVYPEIRHLMEEAPILQAHSPALGHAVIDAAAKHKCRTGLGRGGQGHDYAVHRRARVF